jgi:hypothetical protein
MSALPQISDVPSHSAFICASWTILRHFRLLDDKSVEVGWRGNKRRACHVGDACSDLRNGKPSVDLTIELIDDCDRRVFRSCDADPPGDLISWQEVAERWNVR